MDFVRWTEEKVGHFIKGNIKYKDPERLGTACFGEQKDGLVQIETLNKLFRDDDG